LHVALTSLSDLAYRLTRSIYRQLPDRLRWRVDTIRNGAKKLVRGYAVHMPRIPAATEDLSWDGFTTQVLGRRGSFRGIFIIELTIAWYTFLFQRPQHMAKAMGELGYLVLYKTDNWGGDNVNGFREVARNVWLTNRPEVDEIPAAVRSFYSTAYVHTPALFRARRAFGPVIYEYIDHLDPAISGSERNVDRLRVLKDHAFGGGVDYVVTSSKALQTEAIAAVGISKTLLVQNGVDCAHYRNATQADVRWPHKLSNFRRQYPTVVGYFGALAPWLWYELLGKLAVRRRDIGFLFIGPDYSGGSGRLPRRSNVMWLGPVEYQSLPVYARSFDICFIPFAPGEIAKTTSPLKLFEYFALEKPVIVTSDMHECTAFPEVLHSDTVEGLSTLMDKALLLVDDEAFRARLRQLADENDWLARARSLEQAFTRSRSENALREIA
jgi:hypothetical protein